MSEGLNYFAVRIYISRSAFSTTPLAVGRRPALIPNLDFMIAAGLIDLDIDPHKVHSA